MHLLKSYVTSYTCFTESSEQIIRDIKRADLFILDEYGGQRNTEYAEEQTTEILDIRANTGKPTIITTNISKANTNAVAADTRCNDGCSSRTATTKATGGKVIWLKLLSIQRQINTL